MTVKEIAGMMDISAVQAQSTLEDIDNVCALAREFCAAAVFCLQAHVPYMRERLGTETGVKLASVCGFPSGAESTHIKVETTKELVGLGCDEIDMVNNIAWLKAGDEKAYKHDIESVVAAAAGRPVKVILECHWLTEEEILRGTRWCAEAGASWVKTSTGWAPTGATVERCALIKRAVGNRCGVKAAGGVRTLEMLLAMQAAGTRRFGIGVRTARAILESV
ncbi:MAG TPA: deoxyribose-phosphate aldolase [Kiritimatiellia bacterium]|nr:deoxyribose-phosphate aldolase [Kiritimatiellia bacterium]HRU71244.1 deoxyribose-phosphate aldolase [Kiritimatiellia bacterium]